MKLPLNCLFSYPANAPTMWQRCHNADANVVSTLVPTLWQCSNVDTLNRPSNVVWTSRQGCVNVVPTLHFDQNPNVATMSSQHWPTLGKVETSFRQRCGNVVAILLSILGTDIRTMFRQFCVNVVATSLSTLRTDVETALCERCGSVALLIGDQLWDSNQATLCEHCVNVGAQHWGPMSRDSSRQRSGNGVWMLSQRWSL